MSDPGSSDGADGADDDAGDEGESAGGAAGPAATRASDGNRAGADHRADGREDRRDGGRAPIELKVEYKRLNTFFYDYTKNISKGGTFIKTDRPLDIGTIFLFKLQVPVDAPPIELRGEVRWVVRAGEAPPPGYTGPISTDAGMGIRFVYANPREREQLEHAVEKMMIDSLGPLIYSRLAGSSGEDDPPE